MVGETRTARKLADLRKMLEGGEIPAAYESNVSTWIDLLPRGFIATPGLMVKVFHSLVKPNECRVFIRRLGEDVAGNGNVLDVVKDRDWCVR